VHTTNASNWSRHVIVVLCQPLNNSLRNNNLCLKHCRPFSVCNKLRLALCESLADARAPLSKVIGVRFSSSRVYNFGIFVLLLFFVIVSVLNIPFRLLPHTFLLHNNNTYTRRTSRDMTNNGTVAPASVDGASDNTTALGKSK